eukprot:1074481-Amorphochlora_amoeboformis.AAC.2
MIKSSRAEILLGSEAPGDGSTALWPFRAICSVSTFFNPPELQHDPRQRNSRPYEQDFWWNDRK